MVEEPRYLRHAKAVHKTEQIRTQLQTPGLLPKARRRLMRQLRYWEEKRSMLS